MYTFDSRVRYSECDESLHLSISGLLNYFQDTSTFHSESLGLGLDFLDNLGCAWVLSYWHIVMKRMPKLNEAVQVTTWPYEFKGFMGSRNFTLKTLDGQLLAYANSLWVYMDVKKGRLKKVDDEQRDLYQLSPPLKMEDTSRKVQVPDLLETHESFRVQRFHLDSNKHVNNEKYISLAASYLPQGMIIVGIRTEYKSSAVLNDLVIPKTCQREDRFIVVLEDEDEKAYAVIEFKLALS